MNILLTGASGFIGHHLDFFLKNKNHKLSYLKYQQFDNLNDLQLKNIECIIHLAAQVHLIKKIERYNTELYSTNTHYPVNLAKQAANTGVKRFIFISTIKVNGEENHSAYTNQSTPQPQDPYAQSKWEAEQGLKAISAQTGMEIVIIRPPLVYGPQVKANFLRLLQWVDKDIPLPLASITNKRSFIFVGNLVNFIECCIGHPQAANQTFLISDGEDLSTPDLINRLAQQFNKKPRLFPFPPSLLKVSFRLLGKQTEAQRLFGTLTLDPQYAYTTLNWTPPFTVDAGLAETVKAYHTHIK